MNDSEFLCQIDLLRELPEDLRGLVVELFYTRTYEDDEFVFRAGDPSDDVFVVREGTVSLFSDTVGELVGLRARIEPGGIFGEVGVMEGSSRALSARANGKTTLLILNGANLIELARGYEALATELSMIAISYSFENRAAKAELARRKEARMRINSPIAVRVEGQDPVPAILENVSLGGACFRGLPERWDVDESKLLSVAVDRWTTLFNVHARVAWRKADRLGIAFTQTFHDHELRIAGALHRLVGQSPAARDPSGMPVTER